MEKRVNPMLHFARKPPVDNSVNNLDFRKLKSALAKTCIGSAVI
jgi:hypothetical protein